MNERRVGETIGGPCNGKDMFCKGLARMLNIGRQGLHTRLVISSSTGEHEGLMLVYVGGDTGKCGVLVNYCPICGKRVNREWFLRKKPRVSK
jgi:hypothetical protein